MFDRLTTFFRAPEAKASRTSNVFAFEAGGRARWTPRDYAALAREGYMANAVVYRAVRLIAENAASCHYLLYEGAAERDQHPLLRLLAQPNARQDGTSFLETVYAHLLLAGNAYVEGVSLDDDVRELYALRPDRMKVVPGPDGWPEAYEYTIGNRGVRFDQGHGKVPPILHLTFFHPLDDHYGLAPLEAGAIAIDTHNSSSTWNKALLDNAARPSGALVYSGPEGTVLSDSQFDRLKRELTDTYQGAVNAGRPLLLEGGLDWKAMSLTPKDMDFLEAKHTRGAGDRSSLRRAADAARHSRRQYLREFPGGQSRVVATDDSAAGGAGGIGAGALAVAAVRQRFARGDRHRQYRCAGRRSHRVVGAHRGGAVPDAERKARSNGLCAAARRRPVYINDRTGRYCDHARRSCALGVVSVGKRGQRRFSADVAGIFCGLAPLRRFRA